MTRGKLNSESVNNVNYYQSYVTILSIDRANFITRLNTHILN
jgi:hypothetical protein